MRDQLVRYIDLLFAGAPQAEEIKQEILQNTLDRYDDLIAQGKSPEAAYRLAISGIGDINEILGGEPAAAPAAYRSPAPAQPAEPDATWKKVLRSIAVVLFILCPTPVLVLQDEWGVCGLLTFVAVGVALSVIAGKSEPRDEDADEAFPGKRSPREELKKSIGALVWALGLCAYFILSFTTFAWHITWVIFPIIAAVQGLINACIDLKEAVKHEK